MKLVELHESLHRNRQRLVLDQLEVLADWVFAEAAEILSPEVSAELDAECRGWLAQRRPDERGHLFITPSASALRTAAAEYFARRPGIRYVVLMAHWAEAGALTFGGDVLTRRIGDLLELDGDTVYGCNEDFSEVFAVDRTFGDHGLTFELFWFRVPRE